ncbi:hypothetical protein FEM48_Zijuj03G0194500 [Ziziphus jujuba var. spinosa]|uniref:Uncharacterized protein n=1 Tax=Ziziphus jujuba var. spinosa TaxID=714518 RepID=A0A978VS65_ZIZJJ|nr:hypothetical protein FEM48_Zijuj03G0194500 [Ziziphus jujuba var. spinosa]
MLSGCTKVTKIPEFGANMKHLSKLWLDGIELICLPSDICSMTSLKKLELSGCSRLQELPENLGTMECSEELEISRTAIQKFHPHSFGKS